MISVNVEQSRKIGEHLKKNIAFQELPFEERPKVEDKYIERVVTYVAAICHSTKGCYKGIVEGKLVNGSPYLFACLYRELHKNPEYIMEGNIKNLTEEELHKILKPDEGELPGEDLRFRERVEIMKECASILEERGGFPFSKKKSSVKEIQEFFLPMFKDPLHKKTNIVIKYMYHYGIWDLVDPQNQAAMVDYHNMRGAFRMGLVNLDEELIRNLKEKKEITVEEDTVIRTAVRDAFDIVGKYSGQSSEVIGTYFWLHFRKDCRSDKPVDCDNCENIMQKEKTKSCVMKDVCKGYNNPEVKSIPETTVDTFYY